jgi:hypothetical protein
MGLQAVAQAIQGVDAIRWAELILGSGFGTAILTGLVKNGKASARTLARVEAKIDSHSAEDDKRFTAVAVAASDTEERWIADRGAMEQRWTDQRAAADDRLERLSHELGRLYEKVRTEGDRVIGVVTELNGNVQISVDKAHERIDEYLTSSAKKGRH